MAKFRTQVFLQKMANFRIPIAVSAIFLIFSPIGFIFVSYANGGIIYLFVKFILRKPDGGPEFNSVSIYGNLLISAVSLLFYFFTVGGIKKVIASVVTVFFISSFILFSFVNILKQEIGIYFLPNIIGAVLTAVLLCSIEVLKRRKS
ncbi:MAG TPA: hypothetical protein VK658_01915 [Chryseolinea sp.]|nr:hypothetical protein [Chryseolinea sp.]